MSHNKDGKNKYNNINENLNKKKGFRALAMGVGLTLIIGVSVYAGNRLTAFGILPITSVSAVQSSLEKVNDTKILKRY